MMELYSYTKVHRSKPIDEDSALHHLAIRGSTAICGIDKRHPDVYDFGFAPVENIEHSKIYICKKCYAIWEKNFKDK